MCSIVKPCAILLFCLMVIIPSVITAQNLATPVNRYADQKFSVASTQVPYLPKTPDSREHMVVDSVSNGKVYIYEKGMDHPTSILLIHGVGNEASRIWGQLIPDLAKQYHVVTFDLPGFGRSNKQNVLYSPLFYAEFIEWVVRNYVQKRPFILIGHSLGGAVALCHAAKYPDNLQRLILLDVSGVIHRMALARYIIESSPENQKSLLRIPFKLFDQLKSNAMGAMEFHGLSNAIDKALDSPMFRRQILKADPQKIAGLALANFDFSNLIYQVKAPAIIIWGADDPISPIRTGKLLAYILKKTQLIIIPETGHNPIKERPDRLNRLIQNALVTESCQSPWKPPEKTDRFADLTDKHDLTLTGHYKYIKISNCRRVRIKNMETDYMEVVGSDVVIENSRINGKDFALNTRASRITLTGVHLTGETAIIASGCELDLAGVKLTGRNAAVRAINGSDLLFSVSRIESPYNKGYIHGPYEVLRGRPL